MPIKVEVRDGQVVSFPDDASTQEIEDILRKDFPPTGEEVAQWLEDSPDYVPTFKEYQSFEEYNKDHAPGGNIAEALLGYGEQLAGLGASAVKSVSKDPGVLLNTRLDEQANTISESLAQGTAMLRQTLLESTDPDSFLFGLKAKLKGNTTQEGRYDQFLDARAYALMIRDLDKGSRLSVGEEAPLNEEVTQLGREFADPTLAVPGLGISKLLSKPLANAGRGLLKKAGNATAIVPRTGAKAADSVSERVSELTGSDMAGDVVGSVTGFTANRLRGAADATETLADAVGASPGRTGLASRIADNPNAPKLLQAGSTAARSLGADSALDVAGNAARAGTEGAAIGGTLGYLNSRDAQTGAGAGFAMGAAGGLINRAVEGATGKDYASKLQNDLESYHANLPADVVESISQMAGGSTKKEVDLFDLHALAIQGGDVAVRYLDKTDYRKFTQDHFGKTGAKTRGVTYTNPEGRPTIVINKGAPGTQIAHELIGHAFTRFDELNPDALRLQEEVLNHVGQDGALADAESYATTMGEAWKERTGWERMADGERIKLSIEERAAELAEALVKGSRKSLPVSATKPWRAFRDRLILAEADSALGRAYAALGRFGITLDGNTKLESATGLPTQSTPKINAAIRSLIRARKRARDQLSRLDAAERRVVRPQTIRRTPEVGAQLEQIGLTRRTSKGYELRSNDEIHAAELEQGQAIVRLLESSSGSGGVTSTLDSDGQTVFGGERFSPEQLQAIESSTVLSPYLKRAVASINQAIGERKGLDVDYFSATRKDKKGRTRYSSGIRQSRRTILPYGLEVSEAGNFYVRAMDLTKLNAKVDKLLKAIPGKFKQVYGDVALKEKVTGDFVVYTQNLSKPEAQRVPSEQLFGRQKRDLLQRIFGPRNPRNNLDFVKLDEKENVVLSFRPDRLTRLSMVEGNLPEITEQAYQLAKENYSKFEPKQLEKVSDLNKRGGVLYKSPDGHRAFRQSSRAKWRFFGPTGKRIGTFYDTLADVQAAINRQ